MRDYYTFREMEENQPKWCQMILTKDRYCLLIKFKDIKKGRHVCGNDCSYKKMNKFDMISS